MGDVASEQVSEALGRQPDSVNIMERHPFDVEVLRIPTAQHLTVLIHTVRNGNMMKSAQGAEACATPVAEQREQRSKVATASRFAPGEAHALHNSTSDLTILVVADNPIASHIISR